MLETPIKLLVPDWPAPSSVMAVNTTRYGGYSSGVYAGLNLGDHVADDPNTVAANRRLLRESAKLPAEPTWLSQVHRTRVIEANATSTVVEADGSVTSHPGVVCAVLTADCLPVLLCNRMGTRVAALHAGWRGLAAGMLEAGVEAMQCSPQDLLAWIGPAIGPRAFEVGEEVREAFLTFDPGAEQAFLPSKGRWLANLALLARQRLLGTGISDIYGGHWCTYSDPQRFYSYRRDGVTGRQASLIWLESRR